MLCYAMLNDRLVRVSSLVIFVFENFEVWGAVWSKMQHVLDAWYGQNDVRSITYCSVVDLEPQDSGVVYVLTEGEYFVPPH